MTRGDCVKSKFTILSTVFILMICIFCTGCGDSEHEKSPEISDKYDYTGTWIGQSDVNSIMILNIMRSDKEDVKNNYMLTVIHYILSSNIKDNIPKDAKVWNLNWTDVYGIYEATGTEEKLTFENGSGGYLGHIEVKVSGKNMTFTNTRSEKSFKLKRMTDYDDMVELANKLKSDITKNADELVRKQYPNLKFNIVDNTDYPAKIIK